MTQLFVRLLKFLLVVIVFTGAYEWWRPFPEALIISERTYGVPDKSVRFFADYTYTNEKSERKTEQHIWDEIFSLIGGAKHYMLFDMFLWNDFQSRTPETTRPLSRLLTEQIQDRLASDGHMAVIFITDPINTVYGGFTSPHYTALRKAGALVVETDLTKLNDSNLLYGAIWRPFFSWWGNNEEGGRLAHPFQSGGNKVTLRSWLSLMNFKANHRKILVVDAPASSKTGGEKMITFVTSSNPHDGSGAHGNVGLEVRDSIWKDVIESERRVAGISEVSLPTYDAAQITDEEGGVTVKLLTEKKIRNEVLRRLEGARRGDTFELAMFYLSERSIIDALIDAANRGAIIRVILDPNKDAFGYVKNGIPNRPVAKELRSQSASGISIRWCDTHGEQCHAKFFSGKTATSTFLMVGSANFTRRNIDGFNLEASIVASSNAPFTAWKDGQTYFDRLWENTDGKFTTDYEAYEDKTIWKSSVYRMMERTGLSTF